MYRAIPIFTTDCTIPEVYFHKAMIKLQQVDRATYRKQLVTPIYWTKKIPTAATCGVYTYFNPEFYVDACENVLQRAFIHAHEIKHIWLRHPQRGKFFRERGYFAKDIPFIHRIFNAAADYVINKDNVALGLEAPNGVLLDDRFTRDDNVDHVYMTLIKEYLEQQQAEPPENSDDESGDDDTADTSDASDESEETAADDSGQESEDEENSDDESEETTGSGGADDDAEDSDGSGDGSGDPVPTDHDGLDDHFEPRYDGTPDEQRDAAEEDERRIQKDVDAAIDDAENFGSKSMGGELSQAGIRHCNPMNPTGLQWNELLANAMTRPGSGGDVNWGKINRRKLMTSGVVTPTRKGTIDRLIITSDISSSIDTDQRDLFHSEFAAIADMLKPTNGTLIVWTNEAVCDTDVCMSGAEILAAESPLYGGNRLCASLEWLRDNGITDGDVHLVFTDGYTPDEDYAAFAAAGCIIVLDRVPDTWVMGMIKKHNIEYIAMKS